MKIQNLLEDDNRKEAYKLALEFQDELLSSWYGEYLHTELKLEKLDEDENPSYCLKVKLIHKPPDPDLDDFEILIFNNKILLNKILYISNNNSIDIENGITQFAQNINANFIDRALRGILRLFAFEMDDAVFTSLDFSKLKNNLDVYIEPLNKIYKPLKIKFNTITDGDYMIIRSNSKLQFGIAKCYSDYIKLYSPLLDTSLYTLPIKTKFSECIKLIEI